MKKADRKLLDESLSKALAPRRPRRALDAILDEYDDAPVSPAADTRLTPPTSLAPDVSLIPDTSHAENISLASPPPLALRGESLASDVSLVPDTTLDEKTVDLWAGVGDIHTGYLRLYGVIVEKLYRHLDPFEQAVYTQLYALSWGFGKPSCRVSWPKLAERSGMGQTAAFKAVKRLADKGLVQKAAPTLGRGKEQGGEFWLPLPARLVDDISLARGTRLTPNASNKEKALKKDSKSVVCDLCKGSSGMIHVDPNNPNLGVRRCDHSRLRE